MRIKILAIPMILIVGWGLFSSCQKELDFLTSSNNTITPIDSTPRVGTIWTYRYYTFYSYGSLATSSILKYKAKTEEDLGGEKWLNIVDVDTDTTVFLLHVKTGGLFQYSNNSSYLLCKDPATLNETYNTFFQLENEVFTVKGVDDILSTGIGDVPAIYYEGFKNGYVYDMLWYHKKAWIVRKYKYKHATLGTAFWRYSTLFLASIDY